MLLFCISILMLRIGLRLVDRNNYLVIAYMFKINRAKYPANICWSSRRLEDVFSVKILRLPRPLEDVLKTPWRRLPKASCLQDLSQDVFKTSWKTKNCYAEDMLKTSWRHVLKTSWRHIWKTSSRRLGGKQNFYWWYLHLTNLNVYLTNLCFTNYIWEI